MFLMGEHTHWQMVGMPMDNWMLAGMAAIPVGLMFSAYGLMPRLAQMRQNLHGDSQHLHFHVADGVPLNIEHWKLVAVLVVALAVDVMKPATLGFVMPGMSAEYEITKPTASLLALVALTGTTVGSVLWGRVADTFGRRAAILLGALMFIGTAICGAMPSFEWNLVMCFLMGASAGGLLPITFTLMAETVPAAHRGWLLVALGGIGTSAGLSARGRRGGDAGTDVQLARAVAAGFADRRAHPGAVPLHSRIAALPVECRAGTPGARGAAQVLGQGGARGRSRRCRSIPARRRSTTSIRSSACASCCAVAMQVSLGGC